MNIQNLKRANQALLVYVPLVAQLKAKDVTLQRIRPLMRLLGNPEKRLKVVHIAGTSGKTSTAYYMAAMLQAAGKKTGLTVSPHIDSVTERVQINGRPLPERDFCTLLGEFLSIVQTAKQRPTYFELLYAFALWVFERQGVDYAVVETGMGGLHDATNVVTQADKICVITDVGLDHMHILGNTLAEIAAQKAGIIHTGNHVFMYEQEPEVMRVVGQRIANKRASLHIVDLSKNENKTGISKQEVGSRLPAFQQRNWQLAYSVYTYLHNRDDLQYLTSKESTETQKIQIPARMEVRQLQGKTVIMDGAHNAQKMANFVSSFRQLYPDVRPAILIGLKHGKDYEDLVPLLTPLASRVVATAFQTTQDLPVQSMDPQQLARAFRAAGLPAVAIEDMRSAVRALLIGPEPICIITGSFYLLAQIRNKEALA